MRETPKYHSTPSVPLNSPMAKLLSLDPHRFSLSGRVFALFLALSWEGNRLFCSNAP